MLRALRPRVQPTVASAPSLRDANPCDRNRLHCLGRLLPSTQLDHAVDDNVTGQTAALTNDLGTDTPDSGQHGNSWQHLVQSESVYGSFMEPLSAMSNNILAKGVRNPETFWRHP